MNGRLKSAIVLGFIVPGIILLLFLGIAINLYFYTVHTANQKRALWKHQQDLTTRLQAAEPERKQIKEWMKNLLDFYQHGSPDAFISSLVGPSTQKPEIIFTSAISMEAYQGIKPRNAQQLKLLGCSNTLISSLGRAQIALPTVLPISWEIKKSVKKNLLQFDTQFLVLSEPVRPSPSDSLTNTLALTSHPLQIAPPGANLEGSQIDAFGNPADGLDHSLNSPSILPRRKIPDTDLPSLASRLNLQGLDPSGEAIINSFLFHVGDPIHIRIGQEQFALTIQAISDNSVVLGWNRSKETYALALPALHEPTLVGSSEENVFRAEEINLPVPPVETAQLPTPSPQFQHNNNLTTSLHP